MPSIGEFVALVIAININISEDRPAVLTRLNIGSKEKPEVITHIVRLNNPDSLRIGFDELRGAFPTQLAAFSDEELLTHLIEKTDEFTGKTIHVGIEHQIKNGIVQKNTAGAPYFNVRLRSAVKNMPKDAASTLARRMLQGIASKKAVDAAFDDAHAS